MSGYCRQCSLAIFGMYGGDLARITTEKMWKKGLACVVLCEGCGTIQVDPDGNCISEDCFEQHGRHH